MRACWLKWVGWDWSISADYIWLNYSGANSTDPLTTKTETSGEIVSPVYSYVDESINTLKSAESKAKRSPSDDTNAYCPD